MVFVYNYTITYLIYGKISKKKNGIHRNNAVFHSIISPKPLFC